MRAMLLAIGLAVVGCGGASSSRTSGPGRVVNRQAPVNPKAAQEFEAAMRALRLGGPEASATAIARLRAAVAIDPGLWEAWHDLGALAYKDGDDEAAIESLGKALAIRSDHVPSLLARAEAHRRARHAKAARADYEAALRATEPDDPNRGDAATRLASLLRDSGDFDGAVAVLRDTVRLSGATARVYTELGLIYLQQERLELAQLVLAKAIELDARDPAAHNARAILALRLGDAQQAFERFDHAASLDESYLDARFNKAAVLLDAGDYARAKDELDAIVKRQADDFAAHVALGVAQRGLAQHDAARATWQRVVDNAARRSTPRADALYNLALLESDFLENPKAAKAHLDRYLQDAPTSHVKRQAAEDKRKELGP